MTKENPRAGKGARAGISITAEFPSHSRNRPKLQANAAMRRRLGMILWGMKLEVNAMKDGNA